MSATPGNGNAFSLRVGYDQDELLGARWWQEHLRHSSLLRTGAHGSGSDPDASRRQALKAMVALGGAALFAGFLLTTCNRRTSSSGAFRPSIDLQRAQGAFVGAPAAERLAYPDGTLRDADSVLLDRSTLGQLATALRPSDQRLQPWYVPTLFQSLGEAANTTLREDLQMICSPAMQEAFRQGEALRELLEHAESPQALALVVDLPGPEAVAFAAGLQPAGAAVFTFDNWPHPRGVVAAHLTLAAAVYYRPRFAAAATPTQAPARRPTVFVLDRNRLANYVDDAGRFDNRYPAKLPEPSALQDFGVQRILYVVPQGSPAQEQDDLNELFVRYRGLGIEVRLLSLGDVTPGEPATAPQGVAGTTTAPRYYWHGSPATHWWFWNHYAWPSRPSGITPQQPPRSSFGATWSPQQRPTSFGAGLARLGQTRDPNFQVGSGRSGSSGRTGGYRGSSS